MSPLCETYLAPDELNWVEPFYPRTVYVCDFCFLVQLEEFVSPEGIFGDYPYFSSYSDSWLRHAERYVAQITERFRLGETHWVVELGSNDGYLLQYVVARGIPALGIEPAANVAEAALRRGVLTRVAFFVEQVARELRGEGIAADLVIGNNVLAQVPNLHDFVAGIAELLTAEGVLTLEFPDLMRLVEQNQFDTIYHEHFSYFSLLSLDPVLEAHGLRAFDVEELASHEGSLRVCAAHAGSVAAEPTGRLGELQERGRAAGLDDLSYHAAFAPRVERTKRRLLRFLIDAREEGRTVAGYGAPGKGNTLLNYCGVRTDLLQYTVDRNPHKQGRFLPGTHIPIYHPDHLLETRPDYVLILPWNLRVEVTAQMDVVPSWGGRFVVPIPEAEVCP
jgi:hypothetical protein